MRFSDFLGDEPDDDGGLTWRKVAASVLGTLNGSVKSTGIFPGTRGELMPWTDEELAYFKAGEYVGRLGGPLLPLAGNRAGPTEGLAPVPADGGKVIPVAGAGTYVIPLSAQESTKNTNETSKVEKTKETSRAARGEVMREQGIPTSQQPSFQSKNVSGREYRYETSDSGGKKEVKYVQ